MIKRLLNELDYSFFAEASLVLFVAVFVIVSVVTLLRNRNETSQHAQIVLDENIVLDESEVQE